MTAIPEQPLRAWQIDRQLRLQTRPFDRRIHGSNWYTSETVFPTGDDLMMLFWNARVPGSGAPEVPYVEMVESRYNQGYDVRPAEALLAEGMKLAGENRRDELRALTAELLARLFAAPRIPGHPYESYECPAAWSDVVAAMDHPATAQEPAALANLEEKTCTGWLGQLAGGSFGTAFEGYHTERIAEVYGVIDAYLTPPETTNDDVVYELVLLDVFEQYGRALTSQQLGLEWVRQIPLRLVGRVGGAAQPEHGNHAAGIRQLSQPIFGLDRRPDARHGVRHARSRLAARSSPPGAPRRRDFARRQRRLRRDVRRRAHLAGLRALRGAPLAE